MRALTGCEVLVAGGGPVGLSAALALARRGVRVAVVEEASGPGALSFGLALHPETLAALDGLGVLADVLELGNPLHHISFWVAGTPVGELNFADLKTQYPMVVVLSQADLERVLLDHLHALGVNVLWNHRLAAIEERDDGVTVGVDELDLETGGYATYITDWAIEKSYREDVRYVIGADGHRSCLRRALGIGYPEVGPSELYGMFELSTRGPVPSEVRMVVSPRTMDAMWPLGGDRVRWSFQLEGSHGGDESRTKRRSAMFFGGAAYPHLTMEELNGFLSERASWFHLDQPEVHWAVTVRFERRLADRFGEGHCWLAGDSAHLAGPLGVQSMNVGIQEAVQLAEAMNDAMLHEGVGASGLGAYGQSRQAEWRRLLGLERSPHAAMGAPEWVQGRELQVMSALPASGELLTQMLQMLGIDEPVVLA